MKSLGLRWRLTLTYAALLAVTLLIASVAGLIALRATLYAGLDASLRSAAASVVSQLAAPITRPSAADREVLDRINNQQPLKITVFDALGHTVDRGPSPVGFVAREGVTQVGWYRVFTQRTPRGWVQTAQDDVEVRTALRRMRLVALLGVFPVLLLAVAVGFAVANRALRPVDQVSDLAARIARSGQASERVPLAPGGDELARLTRTVNEMLARLEALLARERVFAHASAHELRTPLSVIRATASLALERERSPEEYREALAQVQGVSEDLTGLTTRLLTLARGAGALDLQTINLADVALFAAEAHTGEAQAKGVRLTLDPDSAPAYGDAGALALAAGNLLQNAIRYVPAGAQVWISSGVDDAGVHLTVEDNGPGVPEGDLARLRQPFQRGTGQTGSGGAGLGLALVAAVMEAHGGALGLDRSPKGGLRARLELPSEPHA
ncbi:sensor histidine kinase [Deinococcus hohokamensis]|uniref:histidine kinase n=1 Tax=Deinococcus hohokamensis TaxID=309883 RepID=A0ABV9IEU7_9DEIO